MGLLALAASSAAPSVFTITIKVPPNTPAESVYVTGSTRDLCRWSPRCIELKSIGHGVLQAEVPVSGDQTIDFKVTRGDWSKQASDSAGVVFGNFTHHYSRNDPEFVGTIEGWSDLAPSTASPLLEVTEHFYSPELRNRRAIRVLLPKSYAAHPNRRYPVIYAHDGQNLFDPKTSSFGVEWNLDEVLHDLAAKGEIEEAIIVGVDCSSDRSGEYSYLLNGEKYAHFLIDTLKPWIDQTYRTRPGRESTYTMGSSMGALISLSLVWNHSDVFSKAGAISLPAMHAAARASVESSPRPAQTIGIYMDYGDHGGDRNYLAPGRSFARRLKQLGLKDAELIHREFEYADHSEADWARRVDIPLKWMLF
jgi:predicted alpha/beta superfamily hydrolase